MELSTWQEADSSLWGCLHILHISSLASSSSHRQRSPLNSEPMRNVLCGRSLTGETALVMTSPGFPKLGSVWKRLAAAASFTQSGIVEDTRHGKTGLKGKVCILLFRYAYIISYIYMHICIYAYQSSYLKTHIYIYTYIRIIFLL